MLAHAINFKNIYSNWKPSFSMMMKCTEHTRCWLPLSVHIESVCRKYINNVCMRAGQGEILKMLYHDWKHCTYNPLPLTGDLNSRIMIISQIFLLSFAPVQGRVTVSRFGAFITELDINWNITKDIIHEFTKHKLFF